MNTIETKENYSYELPLDIEMEDMYRKIFKDLIKIIKITKLKGEVTCAQSPFPNGLVTYCPKFVATATVVNGETEVVYRVEPTCMDICDLFMRDDSNRVAMYTLMCSIIRKEHGDDAIANTIIRVNNAAAGFSAPQQQQWGGYSRQQWGGYPPSGSGAYGVGPHGSNG